MLCLGKRLLMVLSLLCLIFCSGCTEEQQAEAKEHWLGIPNKNPPELAALRDYETDGPRVKQYKEFSRKRLMEIYPTLSTPRARELFIEDFRYKVNSDIDILSMRDSGLIGDRDVALLMHSADQQQKIQSELRYLNRTR